METKKIQLQLMNENGEPEADMVPKTLAEIVECSDGESIEEKVHYTNDTPIVQPTGDIQVGEVFEGVPISDMLTKILYPYVKPQVSIGATVAAGVKEKGTSFSPVITVTPVKKSRPITSVTLKRGNDQVESNSNGAVLTHTADPVTDTVTFAATVSDGQENVSANLTYTFVHPFYVGSLTTENPTAAQIKAMTKRVVSKSTQEYTYNIDEECMVAACPPGWVLSSITDPSNFEILSSFRKIEGFNLGTTEEPVNYTVYISDRTTQENFKLKFA